MCCLLLPGCYCKQQVALSGCVVAALHDPLTLVCQYWGQLMGREGKEQGVSGEELGAGWGIQGAATHVASYPQFLKLPHSFSLLGHVPSKWVVYVRGDS